MPCKIENPINNVASVSIVVNEIANRKKARLQQAPSSTKLMQTTERKRHTVWPTAGRDKLGLRKRTVSSGEHLEFEIHCSQPSE